MEFQLTAVNFLQTIFFQFPKENIAVGSTVQQKIFCSVIKFSGIFSQWLTIFYNSKEKCFINNTEFFLKIFLPRESRDSPNCTVLITRLQNFLWVSFNKCQFSETYEIYIHFFFIRTFCYDWGLGFLNSWKFEPYFVLFFCS